MYTNYTHCDKEFNNDIIKMIPFSIGTCNRVLMLENL